MTRRMTHLFLRSASAPAMLVASLVACGGRAQDAGVFASPEAGVVSTSGLDAAVASGSAPDAAHRHGVLTPPPIHRRRGGPGARDVRRWLRSFRGRARRCRRPPTRDVRNAASRRPAAAPSSRGGDFLGDIWASPLGTTTRPRRRSARKRAGRAPRASIERRRFCASSSQLPRRATAPSPSSGTRIRAEAGVRLLLHDVQGRDGCVSDWAIARVLARHDTPVSRLVSVPARRAAP